MQVKETLSEGLKREYEVVVPAADLDQRVNAKLDEIKGRVNIAGFRPGKVPMSHLKRVYGKSVMSEVIQQASTIRTRKSSTTASLSSPWSRRSRSLPRTRPR